MELQPGVCGICNSTDLILNSEDSRKYVDLIYGHFQEELTISKELISNCEVCPVCVYQITQIISKNSLFSTREVNENVENGDICKMCKGMNEILSIKDESFLNKCKPWLCAEDRISICTNCFYLVEVRFVLKDHLRHKMSVKDDIKCTPIRRSLKSRRKSSCSDQGSASKGIENASNNQVLNNSSESDNIVITSDVNSTPVQSRKRRSKNLGELLQAEENCSKKEEQSKVYKKEELSGYNFSNISNFSPLCSSDIKTDDDIQQDKKLFNYVPFVKMKTLKNAEKNTGNYVCSLSSHGPIIKVRRTPPIKIKTIKNVDPMKNKKKNSEKKENHVKVNETKQNSPVEETPKRLIVVVQRMKISSETSIEGPEIEEAEKSSTPKKKKRVHFDDTPTIIITEDDYTEDLEQRNKNDENRKKIITKSIMVSEQKEDLTIQDEESESENEETLKKDANNGSLKNTHKEEEAKEERNENSSETVEECEKKEEIQNPEDVEMKENEKDANCPEGKEASPEGIVEASEDEDSLKGFVLVSHEDEDFAGFQSESSEKNSEDVVEDEKIDESDKEKDNNEGIQENGESVVGKILSDNLDEIELLLEKYSPLDANEELTEKDKTEDEKETNNAEKDVENSEKVDNKEMSELEDETNEDFGSLIDEVHECLLTSSKDILDKSEKTPNEECDILEASSSNVLDVLDDSFVENCTDLINTESEKVNSLKRKHGEDESEEMEIKRGKVEIS